jgi:hypothetical protein
VYSHLLRHSRLVAKGALRLVERSKAGHVIEVRLPEEMRRVRTKVAVTSSSRGTFLEKGLEKDNFWKDKALRQAIHLREGGACFYCLRRVKA